MSDLGAKSLICLRMAAMPADDVGRWRIYRAASEAWSEKAIDAKFQDLVDRGYLECGVTARTGWLTAKGRVELGEVPPTGAQHDQHTSGGDPDCNTCMALIGL